MGFVITIGTLYATYRQARQAKKSADAARDAARETSERVRRSIARVDTSATLGAVVALIDRIYEHQSRGAWERVPEFYKDARNLLAEVQGESSALAPAEKEYVLKAASEFASVERTITRRSNKGLTPDDAARMNQVITRYSSGFITMRQDLGRRDEA